MSWLIENWFWLLIFIAFIAMHMFGHGGHGNHRDIQSQNTDERERGTEHAQVGNKSSGGHQP